MDPVIDNEWLTCKNDPVEEAQPVGNVARSWQWRERGINPPNYPQNKTVLENIAEDILVQKPLTIRSCDLPGYPRSTFLMVFSPDGTKVASTHGNHNVYVSELASGKHVRILKGHPRTPWCIAFHPSHPQLIGSGCLGGQVRVWDISSGGSEVWNVRKETVIASIAFHPREQLLVIATHNELYFWDWSQPAPFTRVCTNNISEKVRYVAFDTLGYKLITGISICTSSSALHSSILQQNPLGSMSNLGSNRREDNDDNATANNNSSQENNGSTQDMIVNSYQNLVQRYDSLVRNYQRLFMVRHRLTNTPPPPNTIDRGTDPMETDVLPNTSGWTRRVVPSTSAQSDDGTSELGPSRPQDGAESGDGEGSSSRLLNLDVLSFDSGPSRNVIDDAPNQEQSFFGSRPSAFQPLTEGRSFRTVDQNERSTRLLPNPFSSISNSRPDRSTVIRYVRSQQPTDASENSSRTSIFTSSRQETSPERSFLQRRRNSSPSQNTIPFNTSQIRNMLFPEEGTTSNLDGIPSPGTNSAQPETTNSSTQMSPASNVDAQAINESLDLIRDILRDSGTRLLNLITNMSLSTLYSVDRVRRGEVPRGLSDDNESDAAAPGAGAGAGGPARLFPAGVRDDFLSTSSESDSDLEVSIYRTRNSTFERDNLTNVDQNASTSGNPQPADRQPTDRMVFTLNNDSPSEGISQETGGINVSLSNNSFHVRTQSNAGGDEPSTSADPAITTPATSTPGPSGNRQSEESSHDNRSQSTSSFNPNRPSTSRDGWPTNVISSEEAYRKVRIGVNDLQNLTVQLTDLWLRGNRITLRELRNMWENLRRRILALHREMPRENLPPLPSIFTRSLLERCMILTQMTDSAARSINRASRNIVRSRPERSTEENREMDTEGSSNSTLNESEQSNSTDNPNDNRPSSAGHSPQLRSSSTNRASSAARRRLQSRWRPEDELRRRQRVTRTRPREDRREVGRSVEVSATRHEVRMRAMQVLSTMFNIMMMCLEERGLSQLIITMLRTLKKALALTCLMLMMNRNTTRSAAAENPPSSDPDVDSLNVVRIQNSEHAGPVDVDGPDDPASPSTSSPRPNQNEEGQRQTNDRGGLRRLICRCEELKRQKKVQKSPAPTTSTASTSTATHNAPSPSTSTTQRWSNRLAVQIAAANRNTSLTARNRRDLYLESKRQKALHRTNPTAHPLIKKRVLPPVSSHRIPALRSAPSRIKRSGFTPPPRRERTDNVDSRNDEPVAGPSNAATDNNSDRDSPRDEMFNEFEQRVNLIRIAHLQAVRLRHAARTRIRRLQTIRLYTPSSVREMFDLQSNNSDSPPENRSGNQNNSESGSRRSFSIRPHILTPRSDASGRPSDEPGHFHTVLNNVAVPLMQVNDLPASSNQGNQPQRMPRIHEYLQPIILAQNAMVIDDDANEGGGGGGGPGGGGPGGPGGGGGGPGGARRLNAGVAGLLDHAGIIEGLPTPSHRVQAWDFTTGSTPDIADSTKNVVVQRCRIHNDASIDISKDGRLLVALLPVPRMRNTNHWLGVYSLEWTRLGQCLHTAVLEQNAVSVALSPTARHLAVGLGTRRFTNTPNARSNVFALLYRLEPLESSSRTGLSPIKELEQNWEHGLTSLNCLRWAPQPGQGLVYANNTGQLIVMS